MNRSKLGTAMRASAMDGMAATACGINVPMSKGLTWGLSAGMAALAGMAIGPIYGVFTTLGAIIGRKGFSSPDRTMHQWVLQEGVEEEDK